jgi:hypothetical protein
MKIWYLCISNHIIKNRFIWFEIFSFNISKFIFWIRALSRVLELHTRVVEIAAAEYCWRKKMNELVRTIMRGRERVYYILWSTLKLKRPFFFFFPASSFHKVSSPTHFHSFSSRKGIFVCGVYYNICTHVYIHFLWIYHLSNQYTTPKNLTQEHVQFIRWFKIFNVSVTS